MTDEELCKALRSALWGQGHHINIKAADRIEALTAENERLEKQCEGLMQAGMNNGQALILAEAKLAKAVERLRVVDALDPEGMIDGCSHSALRGLVLRMGEIARTTLAEIEGEKV